MVAALLDIRRPDLDLRLVRMAFSRTVSENGRPGARKALHLLGLVPRILKERWRGATVLYFPPSGSDLVPVLRDVVLLALTRWAFPVTVFHFHAGGLSDRYERSNSWQRRLLDLGYKRPEVAIRLAEHSPADDIAVRAQRTEVVPNGIADPNPHSSGEANGAANDAPRILFVAFLRPPKGIEVLLAAAGLLEQRGVRCAIDVVGEPSSPEYADELVAQCARLGIVDRVSFHGVLTGVAKDDVFRRASVFCFPTYYGNENLPVVLLEAMAFGLPVVTTRWRALPDVVVDGETGLLVPVHDPTGIADALERLVGDRALRDRLGAAGRARFLTEYTAGAFQRRMGDVLVAAARQENRAR